MGAESEGGEPFVESNAGAALEDHRPRNRTVEEITLVMVSNSNPRSRHNLHWIMKTARFAGAVAPA
jgi:hypothetical protein